MTEENEEPMSFEELKAQKEQWKMVDNALMQAYHVHKDQMSDAEKLELLDTLERLRKEHGLDE